MPVIEVHLSPEMAGKISPEDREMLNHHWRNAVSVALKVEHQIVATQWYTWFSADNAEDMELVVHFSTDAIQMRDEVAVARIHEYLSFSVRRTCNNLLLNGIEVGIWAQPKPGAVYKSVLVGDSSPED